MVALVLGLGVLAGTPGVCWAQDREHLMGLVRKYYEFDAKLEAELPDYKKLRETEYRDKVKEKVVPILKDFLATLDEMGKSEFVGGLAQLRWVEIRTLLVIFGDADAVKRMEDGVKLTDGQDKFESDAVKMCFDYFNATTPEERNTVIEAFSAMGTKRPDRHEVSGAAGFMLAVSNSVKAEDAILEIIHNKLSSETSATIAVRYEGPRKLRNAMNKELNFNYKTWDNKDVKASDFRGKVLMLHFFIATDARSTKDVNKAARIYIVNKSKGLELVSVSCDRVEADLTVWMQEYKRASWPILYDDFTSQLGGGWHPLTLQVGVSKLPTTLLIDRKGVLRYANPAKLDEKVKELLAENP